jgi:hypothetical protein
MTIHAKAKQSSVLSANANSCLSLEHWLEPLLDRIQKGNNNTETEIVCLERANHLCADARTEVCNLT